MAASNLQIDYNALANALLAVGGGPQALSVLGAVGANLAVGGEAGAGSCGVGLGSVSHPGGAVIGPKIQESVPVVGTATFGSSDENDGTGSDAGSVMSGGSVGDVSDRVRGGITFGDLHDDKRAVGATVSNDSGFYSTVVRNSNAVELRKSVERYAGVKLPKKALVDLAICTYTAGVMPSAVVNGKQRLRVLAAIGDASVTLHLVVMMAARGANVESAQAARSKRTSNASFREVMRKAGWQQLVSYASGVDPATCVATATAFEAVVGVLTLYCTPDVVRSVLTKLCVLT